MGLIEIADGSEIGANSYVDKSFTEEGITIASVPAGKVSNSARATEILRKTRNRNGLSKQLQSKYVKSASLSQIGLLSRCCFFGGMK